ncbi:MAG: hypothetical protein ACM3PU_02845 [Gemmatimonadota bacterium]
MGDDPSKRQGFMADIAVAVGRHAERQRLSAALVDAARAIQAARDRAGAPPTESDAMLDRCDALLRGARAAATARSQLVADDCLHQIERELVAAMSESELRATFALYRAEGDPLWPAGRRGVAAELADGEGAPSVAALQTLMRAVHASRQSRTYRSELARRQIGVLAGLLIGAVLFFSGWALVGGFEWVVNEDVDLTLAMMLVNGVLFGFLGGLLSVAFSLLRFEPAMQAAELRGSWAATIARVFIGSSVAIPIAFFLQSGLINLGNVSPAFDLALCFVGGFSERWFIAQFDRALRRPES